MSESFDSQSDLFKLVKADLDKRDELGWKVFGGPMVPFDGKRDALKEAYEEALDLAMYLKQVLVERELGNKQERVAMFDNERLRKENLELRTQLSAARSPVWYPRDVCAGDL